MKIRTQLLIGYVVVFALMIVIAGITYQSITALLETQSGAHRIHERIAHSISVEKSVMDMQTGKRGFQITGNEEYLEPYEDGKRDYENGLAEIRVGGGLSDHPLPTERLVPAR